MKTPAPQPPAKDPILTPKRIGLAFLVAVAIVAVVGTAMAAPGIDALEKYSPAPKGCDEAAKWHYEQAMQGGGEEHFYAGLAAQQLEAMGEDCHWQEPEA